jgi:hypothetical protein
VAQDVERLKARRDRKKVPLSEAEMKEQMSKDDADKADPALSEDSPPEPQDTGTFKFTRDFRNNEFLQIMEDFLQGPKLTTEK